MVLLGGGMAVIPGETCRLANIALVIISGEENLDPQHP